MIIEKSTDYQLIYLLIYDEVFKSLDSIYFIRIQAFILRNTLCVHYYMQKHIYIRMIKERFFTKQQIKKWYIILKYPMRNKEVKFETPPFSLEEIRNWRGKRLKKENRVFFTFELEAQKEKYRPCGICMKNDYIKWKMDLFDQPTGKK